MLALRHRRLQSERVARRRVRFAVRGGRVSEFQILLRHVENVILQRAIRRLLRDELFACIGQFGDGLRASRVIESEREKGEREHDRSDLFANTST